MMGTHLMPDSPRRTLNGREDERFRADAETRQLIEGKSCQTAWAKSTAEHEAKTERNNPSTPSKTTLGKFMMDAHLTPIPPCRPVRRRVAERLCAEAGARQLAEEMSCQAQWAGTNLQVRGVAEGTSKAEKEGKQDEETWARTRAEKDHLRAEVLGKQKAEDQCCKENDAVETKAEEEPVRIREDAAATEETSHYAAKQTNNATLMRTRRPPLIPGTRTEVRGSCASSCRIVSWPSALPVHRVLQGAKPRRIRTHRQNNVV